MTAYEQFVREASVTGCGSIPAVGMPGVQRGSVRPGREEGHDHDPRFWEGSVAYLTGAEFAVRVAENKSQIQPPLPINQELITLPD